MRMLACVLLVEINDAVRDKRMYDEASYIEKLKALPELPWDDEDEEEEDIW
jgi:hypothetical protein